MRLSKKLSIYFIITILISIFIISFVANSMINTSFDRYLVNKQDSDLNKIFQDINDLYSKNNRIDEDILNEYMINKNYNISFYDNKSGHKVKCNNLNMNQNGHMGSGMGHSGHGHGMGKRRHNPRVENDNLDDFYEEKQYEITDPNTNKHLGTLVIGFLDDSQIQESTILFKDTLKKSFLISSIITIIIGIILSVILSRTLTNPLTKITTTAKNIQKGDLTSKSTIESNILEINELSNSINYLSDTLSQQDKIRSQYASDISHELRTPLTTLQTHLEAILDGVWPASEDNLTILLEETNRLNNLVENLKKSFNSKDYEIVINKENLNVSDELHNIIRTYTPLYNKSGYNIIKEIDSNIYANLDKDKFKQIINNILSNSYNYLSNDGLVTISLKEDNSNIYLNIEDSGSGISEEDLENIFNRFYRVDSSRNKNTGGSGLGLSIVKNIIQAHKGDIEINSKLNTGTCVNIILPK